MASTTSEYREVLGRVEGLIMVLKRHEQDYAAQYSIERQTRLSNLIAQLTLESTDMAQDIYEEEEC
jgi:hypothetical protein